jgi:protein-disulfide isomerase
MARNQSSNGSGPPVGASVIVGAVILGACLVAGSLLIRSSLAEVSGEVQQLRSTIAAAESSLRTAAAPAARPAGERRNRPDPDQRYEISIQQAPVKGPESARVTIVEWSDFQCPFCRRVGPTIEQIRQVYPDDVRFAFMHLPLRSHPKAPAAHAAAEAAHQQGRFWEMHDLIFENQAEMSPEKYVEYAREIGLDVERFQRDVASSEVKSRIDADKNQAASLGVTGTPSFFVNGRFVSGAKPFAAFKEMIDEELGKKS